MSPRLPSPGRRTLYLAEVSLEQTTPASAAGSNDYNCPFSPRPASRVTSGTCWGMLGRRGPGARKVITMETNDDVGRGRRGGGWSCGGTVLELKLRLRKVDVYLRLGAQLVRALS